MRGLACELCGRACVVYLEAGGIFFWGLDNTAASSPPLGVFISSATFLLGLPTHPTPHRTPLTRYKHSVLFPRISAAAS